MEWWGHSKTHGWVVLDRSLPGNMPGTGKNLLFLRCRDSATYVEERKNWDIPQYRFAPNYIASLGAIESVKAVAELEALKSRWPEFERLIRAEFDSHNSSDASAGDV